MVGTNPQAVALPRIVGRYALFDEIAAGGMATIHLGRLVGPVGFSRTVAIKTLHPQFAKDPEFVEMFLEEARLASRIQHPNVISTLDVATAEGEVFLVMEYVAGESLAKLVRSALKRGDRMPVEIAVSVLAGMLHGLHATHEAKNEQLEPMHIVHRDVSPQNVLVGLDGVARIFDFGVAKAAAMRSQATTDGQMKGKLSYMSPEQLNSREVDRRTDVFAAGVVAWECLTSRRLFSGSDPGEVLAKVLTLDIPPPIEVQTNIPRGLSDAVMRALERSPEQRWQTARDFAIELERNAAHAAPHMVGDWVAQNASDALQDRRRRVEAVERSSLELGRMSLNAGAPVPVVAHPTPFDAPPDVAQSGDGADPAGSSATSRSSNLTVSSSAAVRSSGMSRPLGFALLFLGCGLAAAAFWYWQQGGFEDLESNPAPAALPTTALPEGRTLPSPEPPRHSPSERNSAPDPGGAPPPVLHIDTLPEQRDIPDAGAAAGRPGDIDADRGAAGHHWRRTPRHWPSKVPAAAPGVPAGKAADGSPPATTPPSAANAPALPNTGNKVGAPPTPPRAVIGSPAASTGDKPTSPSAVGKPECEPPWYVDGKGIHRLRPQCL
jgi:serine/threonine-protein kinase